MDSISTELCRLCLQFSDDLVNIFDTFGDSSIASILAKHFWFQVNKNDGFTEWLCQICWINTKTFHIYYKRMELCQRNYYRSSDLIKTDLVKQKQNVSLRDERLEPDLNIVKCEETELTEVDMQISKENSSDEYSREYCDESKSLQTSDDEDQSSYKKPKNDDFGDVNETESQKLPPNIERKSYKSHSRSEIDKQDAQIRELFSMKCESCSDVEFETLGAAKRHYRLVHNMNGYLMCCGNKFSKRNSILCHVVVHTNPGAYRCDQCGRDLPNKKALKAHIQNHIPLDSRPYKCGLCSSSFRTPSILKNHEQNKHTSKNGETFPCDKCNKKFRSKLLVQCHIRNVHEYSLKYVCEICAHGFKKNSLLQRHLECAHPTTPRPKAQCSICSAWLTDDRGLHKHLKRHGRQQKDIVNCPICKKVCKDKNLLGSHITNVHGERKLHCVSCDKAFRTATGLKEHIATHTGEDLYSCKYCEKKFKSNANMFSHRKKAHVAELSRDTPEHITLKEKPTE